jgi:hypothetical protein
MHIHVVTAILSHDSALYPFHESFNHAYVCDLAVVEILLNFVHVFLREALVWIVLWHLILFTSFWLGVQEYALFVSILAETKQIVDTGDGFLEEVELLHLLQLLHRQLRDVNWLEGLHHTVALELLLGMSMLDVVSGLVVPSLEV